MDPEDAKTTGDKFRSTERIYMNRNGDCRHVQDLLGMTITTEETWRIAESEEGKPLVKFHKKKLYVCNPKGETKEEIQGAIIEWVISVIDPDRLSVTMADSDGMSQQFGLKRTKD